MKKLEYGFASKAWQPLVGCSPSMPCAPRCWARKTMARVVECQRPTSPKRAEFYQIALTGDGSKWSGEVYLDPDHLHDPLKWKTPQVIATGFHGDWGRLKDADKDRMLVVMSECRQHKFFTLTKTPSSVSSCLAWHVGGPLKNVNIGCSVMNLAEADVMRFDMENIASMGWKTHVWYEPALGPVDWTGWEFLSGIIAGGESGPGARPANPDWFRATRDWCLKNGVPFTFKQWGSHDEHGVRCKKRVTGRLLDGREWSQFPGAR